MSKNLYNIIHKQVAHASIEELIDKLEYSSTKKGLKSFESFLSHKTLHSWLSSGHYDFKYSAIDFYIKLAEVLNISREDVSSELERYKLYKHELDKFSDAYIFVNTNFKRTTEPIHALAICGSQRRLEIEKALLVFKSEAEIFSIISTQIKTHFKQTQGDIGIWGNVVNYVFHLSEQTYLFDTNGKLIENIPIDEPKVSLVL
ncbi:MAG: hypothetical protein Q9M40_07830 [Sulfurimonas sp.]|nr:hypothetical protein [Sulfurimonas sp.]